MGRKKVDRFILLLCGVLVVSASSALYLRNNLSLEDSQTVKHTSPSMKPCPNNSPRESDNLTIRDETDGWKTYSNQEVDLTFRYPSNWGVIVDAKWEDSEYLTRQINIGPNNLKNTEGYDGYFGFTITDKTRISISKILSKEGKKDTSCDVKNVFINKSPVIKISEGKYLYEGKEHFIVFSNGWNGEDINKIYWQILGTVKVN